MEATKKLIRYVVVLAQIWKKMNMKMEAATKWNQTCFRFANI